MPRSGPGPDTARPSSRTRPSLGGSRPATSRRIVDLPQPDVPTSTANSRSLISKLMSWSAVTLSPRRVRNRMLRRSSVEARHDGRPLPHPALGDQGKSQRWRYLKIRSEIRPSSPMTRMPTKMRSVNRPRIDVRIR